MTMIKTQKGVKPEYVETKYTNQFKLRIVKNPIRQGKPFVWMP